MEEMKRVYEAKENIKVLKTTKKLEKKKLGAQSEHVIAPANLKMATFTKVVTLAAKLEDKWENFRAWKRKVQAITELVGVSSKECNMLIVGEAKPSVIYSISS